MSDFIQNELVGLTIAKRQDELKSKKKPKTTPFISMINVKEPVGFTLPKVINDFHKSKVLSEAERKNRLFLHLTESRFKQKEMERLKELSLMNKRYFSNKEFNFTLLNEKQRKKKNLSSVSNEKLEYGGFGGIQKFFKTNLSNLNFKPKAKTKLDKGRGIVNESKRQEQEQEQNKQMQPQLHLKISPNLTTGNSQEANLNINTIADVNDNETNELIDFAKNLNFDKYLKDASIREALNLIKHKINIIENHNQNKSKDKELTQEEAEQITNMINEYFSINDCEGKEESATNNKESATKPTQVSEKVTDLKPEEQFRLVMNELHKNSKLKPIHSALSIMKILQREGILLNPKPNPQSDKAKPKSQTLPYMYSSQINNSIPEQL